MDIVDIIDETEVERHTGKRCRQTPYRNLRREITRHGKEVWYFRVGMGRRIRLPGKYGSDKFMAAYHELTSFGWRAEISDSPTLLKERRKILKPKRSPFELPDHPFVYFMRAGSRVKIGFSKNPYQRVFDMQTAIPERIEIVCLLKGGSAMERKFHEKFQSSRIGGEWFTYEGAIEQFLTGK